MTKIRAVAHSGGAFRHGPSLDVDATHVAVILALGRAAELQTRLARECVARGGKVILVTDHREEVASDQLLSVHVEPVPEPWDALTSVLPAQALTLALIERLGSSYVRVQTTTE
jgi:glucosamine--fructose-6-phosphate aminotransferase (isomerizing)